jgi:acyl-CoA synthetase (AMP-forming)/AMP-acid ligase II/acyl carrier protein
VAAKYDLPSLSHVLHARVEDDPGFRSYTFLRDGERDEDVLSNADLLTRSRVIAEALGEVCRPGDRVVLLYQPGLEFICGLFGCFEAGVVAVPTYPPEPARLSRTLPRLQAVARDCEAAVVLTSSPILGMAQALWKLAPELESKHWIATDTLPASPAELGARGEVKPDDLAMIQYTSGSTGDPRGVMLSHRNLMENERTISLAFAHDENAVFVSWLPVYHDMGLIGMTLQPMYMGCPFILMSPEHFLLRPLRWLQAVTRYHGTTSGGPNFAYDLCVRKATPADVEKLDLSSWLVAFNGSEPVRPETIARFTETFAPCGFRPQAFLPCYGLAEATLLVSGGPQSELPVVRSFDGPALDDGRVVAAGEDAKSARRLAGSGEVGDRETVVIVDATTGFPVEPGQIGEVWVAGPNIAGGYWKRADDSARTFGARLAFNSEQRFLRTGDLGFLHAGELFITGRIKDLIIIRGRNVYPHDVERVLEASHRMIRPGCSAAFSVDDAGEERLVVVAEVTDEAKDVAPAIIETVRKVISEELELHCHAVGLIRARTMPKTSSGKVQRALCRTSFLQGTLELVAQVVDEPVAAAPRAQAAGPDDGQVAKYTTYLVGQIASLLNTTADRIDPNTALGSLGLDSLAAAELSTAIEDDLGQRAYMSDMRSDETIVDLAKRIASGRKN